MNIFNRFLLGTALLPKALYNKMGVDIKHLRSILTVKLMMDDRRPNTFHQTRQRKSDKAISAATIGTMILSGVMGIIFTLLFRISDDIVTQFMLYFTLYLVMLVATLISDFTSVLIDVRDNYIIFPKPISDKTIVLSRLLHILMHITKIILPMTLPALVYLIIFNGAWTGVVFFLTVIFASAFSIFLINIIYLFILKFTSPKKFQVFISYVQIFMTIIIFGGYQLVAQQAQKFLESNFVASPSWYYWFAPQYWFALNMKFFTAPAFDLQAVAGAILTVVITPLSLWLVIKYFAPSFNQKLSLITTSSEEASAPSIVTEHKSLPRTSFQTKLSRLFSKSPVEEMGFLLTWKLTARLRDFKLKVYPSIGYMIVIIGFSAYRSMHSDLTNFVPDQKNARLAVMSIIYVSAFVLIGALGQLQFSDKFKAAWFYFTTPISKPGHIFSGAFKAVAFKFYVPFILLLSIGLIYYFGIDIIPNIILAALNVLLGCQVVSLITLRNFPFSALQQTAQKVGAMIRSMFSLTMLGLLGLLQYLVFNFLVVVLISIALSALANWLLLDYMRNKSWAKVLATYND